VGVERYTAKMASARQFEFLQIVYEKLTWDEINAERYEISNEKRRERDFIQIINDAVFYRTHETFVQILTTNDICERRA